MGDCLELIRHKVCHVKLNLKVIFYKKMVEQRGKKILNYGTSFSSKFIDSLYFLFWVAQTQNKIDRISNYLEELSQGEMFGAAGVIMKNDQLVLQKAYGYANKEHKVSNKINTLFNIASVGKMFSAVAILQLYEQGKLDLNTPVGKIYS